MAMEVSAEITSEELATIAFDLYVLSCNRGD